MCVPGAPAFTVGVNGGGAGRADPTKSWGCTVR